MEGVKAVTEESQRIRAERLAARAARYRAEVDRLRALAGVNPHHDDEPTDTYRAARSALHTTETEEKA